MTHLLVKQGKLIAYVELIKSYSIAAGDEDVQRNQLAVKDFWKRLKKLHQCSVKNKANNFE